MNRRWDALKRALYSLRYRIAISIFLLEAVMLGLVLSQTLPYSQRNTQQLIEQNERLILDFMADVGRTALFTYSYDELQQYVDRLPLYSHTKRVLVVNNAGIVVVSSNFSDVGKPAPALSSSPHLYWRTKDIKNTGRVVILFSDAELNSGNKRVLKLGLAIGLSGMTLIAIFSNIFGFFLTRKLTILKETVNRFAHGDYQAKASFSGQDEIAVVGQSFDDMAARIEKTIEELEANRAALNAAKEDLELRVEDRTHELKIANELLQKLSTTDGLTQIANRRQFDHVLDRELKRARRHERHISLLLLDVDFFKSFNDTYGHQAGDECLIKIAMTLAQIVCRPSDLVARYGGEEFAVILPETNFEGALTVASNICRKVELLGIPHEKSTVCPFVTVSIGVSSCMDYSLEPLAKTLLESADNALYKAKHNGRNQIYPVKE